MFAVCVDFTIAEGAMDAFMPLIARQAGNSVRLEPGCHRFDVCRDAERPDRVFLYELYDDSAAFDAHRATPHYAEFDAAAAPMIAAKSVTTWGAVTAGEAGPRDEEE